MDTPTLNFVGFISPRCTTEAQTAGRKIDIQRVIATIWYNNNNKQYVRIDYGARAVLLSLLTSYSFHKTLRDTPISQ
jgi:hypothetical protein